MFLKIKEFITQFKYGLLIFVCIVLMSFFSFFYSLYTKNQFENNTENAKESDEVSSKPIEFLSEKQKFEINKQQKIYYENLPYKNFNLTCNLLNNVSSDVVNKAVVFNYILPTNEKELLLNFGCSKNTTTSDKNFTKLDCKNGDIFIKNYLEYLNKSFIAKTNDSKQIFRANNIYTRFLISAGENEYSEPLQENDAQFVSKVYELTFGDYKMSYLNSIFTISIISDLKTSEAKITLPPFFPSTASVNGLKDLPTSTCKLVPMFPYDQNFHRVVIDENAELKVEEIQILENLGIDLTYVLDAKNNSFYPIFSKTGYLTGDGFKYLKNKKFVLGIFD